MSVGIGDEKTAERGEGGEGKSESARVGCWATAVPTTRRGSFPSFNLRVRPT